MKCCQDSNDDAKSIEYDPSNKDTAFGSPILEYNISCHVHHTVRSDKSPVCQTVAGIPWHHIRSCDLEKQKQNEQESMVSTVVKMAGQLKNIDVQMDILLKDFRSLETAKRIDCPRP